MAKYYTKISDEDGNEFLLAVNITGHGAPTEDTEAEPGMCYLDEDSEHGDLYKCIGVLVTETRTVYRWKKLAGQEEVERLEKAIEDLPQADMAQNDPTAPDYVKNRLAWTDDLVETVVLEETDFVFSENFAELPTPIELIEGQTYSVTYNGNVYSCVAWYIPEDEMAAIGNGELIELGAGNGEPFLIFEDAIWSESVSAKVRITSALAEVHQIDSKYIPTLPTYKVKNAEFFCFDLSGFIDSGGYVSLETTLSNEAYVYSINPVLDWGEVPETGLYSSGGVGIYKKSSWTGTYFSIIYYDIQTTIQRKKIVFVHSDNVEQGISDYKADAGIE